MSTTDVKGEVHLRPYQQSAIDAIDARAAKGCRRILVVSPTGCHREGQSILRFDGITVPVETIRVGDLLMGPDSTPRRVLRLCRGEGAMVRIVPNKGEPFVVNDEHVLSLVRGDTTLDVRVKDWLGWSANARRSHLLFRTAVAFPDGPALRVAPYFLGILLGDGSLVGSVGITKPDPEIEQLAHEQAALWGLRVRSDDSKGTRCVTHYLVKDGSGSNALIDALYDLGLKGHRSGEKFIPIDYKLSSRKSRLALLAGLLDADGSLAGTGYDFISKSKWLAHDVAFVARSLGLAAYVVECTKSCPGFSGRYHRVSISGDCSIVPCRIPRKKAPRRQRNTSVLRTGFTVERLGVEPFFGFTLDADGRYVMGDFTVTHNSGKSCLFAHLANRAAHRGEGVLVVAHRRELINQAYERVVQHGVPETNVGVLMASDTRRRPVAPVQVASIDTLRHRPKPPAELVVIDEAHRCLAPSYLTLRELYPNALHVGFTATPYRADLRGLGEFYDDLVVVATVKKLIAEGYLVDPRVFTVPSDQLPNLSGVRVRGGDYDERQLADAVDQQRLVGNIVDHWQKHAAGVRTIAFAVSVQHSQHIAERFREQGIPAEHLDGTTPAPERDAILSRLRSGETLVVSNVGVLCEGTDIPAVKCAVLARPTKSTGLYLQQAGRILRPWNGERAIILDHAGCAREHGLPQDDREFSLEAAPKRKRREGATVPLRTCTCLAILPPATKVCPECGSVFEVAREVPEEVAGELVEAKSGDVVPRAVQHRAIGFDDAVRRTYFEQQRALGRSRRKPADWAVGRFIARYGTLPPSDWLTSSWGSR
jgi:superfamily II DNA or RNA helicase